MADTTARIANRFRAQLLAGEFAKCPELTGGENACEGGKHRVARDLGDGQFPEMAETRACPLEARRKAREQQAAILARCPAVVTIAERYELTEWSPDAPMWRQLLARVDRKRAVTAQIGERRYDLAQLVALIERGCANPSADSPHVMFSGPCGTGKTTLQAVMYLAAVESGIAAKFVDSIELRTIAANLTSRWDETARRAHDDLARLVQRPAIFWSDAGDSAATEKAFPETLATLLERFTGRIVTSTNLSPKQIVEHPDLGQRILSRLMAARKGQPAILVLVDGADQRRHGMGSKEVTAL
jgi:hypothetical protein